MSVSDLGHLPLPVEDHSGWPWKGQIPQSPRRMVNGQKWPKISIVTPSHNQGQYIEETIRSVLLQGYPNLEYMVIDGGSEDQSVRIIKKYEPWLAYWTSEADEGQAHAISKGFQRATGQILAWINSDDFYEPGTLKRVATFFVGRKDLVFANGDVNLVGEDSQFRRRIYAMRPSAFFAANSGQHGWPQQGCFWLRSIYEQVGGIDPSLHFCMDKDLFIRLVKAGRGQRIPGPPLANFRLHSQAKSTLLQDTARRETSAIVDKYGQRKWASRPALMSVLWWVYRKEAALRLRLNRYFGYEY
jgi:glycosyltransferase involved in cell wall biosynthesis